MKLICFLPWGYPDREHSPEMAEWYIKGGCDCLEIGIPPRDAYLDNDFLREVMRKAYLQESDPGRYLEDILLLRKAHPETELLLMLYEETILAIGAAKLADFCREARVGGIICGDLKQPELKSKLQCEGVPLASVANFTMTDEMVERCRNAAGFIYQRAVRSPGQEVREGCETLEKCIRYLRENGVVQPIYCGMGIREPEDARAAMEAGADGCFLGSSVVALFDTPEALRAAIEAYRSAILTSQKET